MNVTPVPLLDDVSVAVEGETIRPPATAANVTTTPLEPGVAIDLTTIETGVVPEAVLHVRVVVEGVTVSRLVARSKPGDAVNVSSRGKSFMPDRFNNVESIMDHPFSVKMLTTGVSGAELCRWKTYRPSTRIRLVFIF